MKRTGECPKCGSRRVGHLEKAMDEGEHHDGTRRVGMVIKLGLFAAREGEMEAYVCTECGYFEEYVANPSAVPWTKLHGFRWVSSR